MKLSCTQENLNNTLGFISHITPKSHHLPILNNILLIAKNNQLEIRSTNLEIGIKTVTRAKVDIEGNFTVNGKTFFDLISLLEQDKVELELSGNQLLIKSGKAESKINGLPPEDFPVLPVIANKTGVFKVKTALLKSAASQVLFASSQDESRPELSGILWWFKKDFLVLAATDSYRLAEKKIPITGDGSIKEDQIIVPLRTTQEVLRVFNDLSEIEVNTGENQIMFLSDDRELISRIIDGKYPDYGQIIPSSPNLKVLIKKEDIIRAIKLAGLFTRAGLNHIDIGFKKNAGVLEVLSAATQVGESRLTLPAQLEGDEIETITFDWRFLLSGIEAIEGQDVNILLSSPQSPAVVKGKDDLYLYLLMPIRK